MIDLDISFEDSPWLSCLEGYAQGEELPVVNLLTLLEGEDEDSVEEAFRAVDEKGLCLSLSGMPRSGSVGEAAVRLRQEAELVSGGMDVRTLGVTDPLRLYLEEIAMQPRTGDEQALAQRFAAGDSDQAEALTSLGLHRVVELAKGHTGWGVLLLDLIQEGSLGLWQAVSAFQGGDYAAFRDQWIRNAMVRAIALQARANGLGQKMRGALEDYRAVDERLLGELGRNPTQEEIAEQLHMSLAETETVGKMLSDARMIQRALPQEDPEEPEAPEETQAVEDTAYFQARQRILELLSTLSEEDAKLLTLRFGLEKGLPLSPEETGKRMGLTPQEVVAREAKALSALRQEK